MIESVALRAEEKLRLVLRIRLENRRQRRLPFIVGFLSDWDHMFALAADVADIEKLSPFCVLIDAVDYQRPAIRRPSDPTKITYAFRFRQLDFEGRVTAAV